MEPTQDDERKRNISAFDSLYQNEKGKEEKKLVWSLIMQDSYHFNIEQKEKGDSHNLR